MRALIRLLPLAALWASCQCAPDDNQAPEVRIVSPRDGEVLRGTGPFVLQGEARDADEVLPATSVAWSSDRGGVLGVGAVISASLSPGAHRLRLAAVDSAGVLSSAEISVTVIDDTVTVNTPPVAFIDAPSNGAYFDQGAAIALQGHATDAEQGALGGAALSWSSSLDGSLGTGAALDFSNASLGHHRVVLTATDNRGESAVASVEFDVVSPGTNHPPQVSIDAPADNAALTLGMATELAGTATDAEDGALSGAALTWSSSLDGALGTGSPLTVTLTQGVHVLTLTATDSQSATRSAAITVSVNQAGNHPPVATITAPANNTTVFAGTAVTFTGTGSDPEDGALTGPALAWSSSLDGALGTGESLASSTLSAGAHLITLTATDSGGNAATASRTLTVLPMNAAPTVSITAPADNAQVSAGTSVVFSASASDPEDGALSGNAVRWSSNLDGSLGTGVSLSTPGLSVGAHTITVTATDSGGRAASASVHVTVLPGTTNIPPIARLTGPTGAQATQSLTFAADTSSDADGTINGWRFAFSDGTPDVTGSASATHTFATPGTYTVTLTVTDDDGATGTATLTVTISPFVRVPVVTTADGASTSCGLVARGATLHVAWYSPQHPAVMYGTFDNGALTAELVDTLGFNTGGVIGGEVRLVLNASGTPFISYRRGSEVWLARKTGGAWVRERADATGTAFNGGNIGLAIDGGGRVAVAYQTSSTYDRIAVALRDTSGGWARTVLAPTGLGTLTTITLRGDLAFTGNGTLLVPAYLSNSGNSCLLTWNGTASEGLQMPVELDSYTSIAVNGARAFVLTGGGLLDVLVAAPLSGSTITRSWYESFTTSQHAVAVGTSGEPRLVIGHGSGLEHIWPTSQPGFWNRLELGSMATGRIDADVDTNGDTRACFFRSGKLMIY